MIEKMHLVFTGPSGSGKSTIIEHVLTTFPSFSFSVSHTTRAPREGEVCGKDYFFVSRDVFGSMIRNKELLEYTEYNGNYYGTSIAQLEDADRPLVLDVEYDGVLYCRRRCPNFVIVYIHCDREVACRRLQERVRGRSGSSSEVENRMRLYDKFYAVKDMCNHVIDNTHDLGESKRNIKDFIRRTFELE